MQRTLEMGFSTGGGRRRNILLQDVKEDVTGLEAAGAMDEIIAKNIFTSPTGDLVSKISARVIEREIFHLDIE